MKIIYPIFALFLLTACSAKQPAYTFLDFNPGSQQIRYSAKDSVNLLVRDRRKDAAVIVYDSGSNTPSAIANNKPVSELLESTFKQALKEQGLQVRDDSHITFSVFIDTLKVKVTRDKGIYKYRTATVINVSIDTPDKTISRKYQREADDISITRPKTGKLEKVLRTQLTEISRLILADSEIRTVIANG